MTCSYFPILTDVFGDQNYTGGIHTSTEIATYLYRVTPYQAFCMLEYWPSNSEQLRIQLTFAMNLWQY